MQTKNRKLTIELAKTAMELEILEGELLECYRWKAKAIAMISQSTQSDQGIEDHASGKREIQGSQRN